MNKTDIIQRIVYVNVPGNAKLVEHSYPAGSGITVSSFGANDTGGLKIVMAQILAESFEAAVVDLHTTPDAVLLRRLHEECVESTKMTLASLIIEEAAEGLIADHRKMVNELAEIAKELGLEYELPVDPFLK